MRRRHPENIFAAAVAPAPAPAPAVQPPTDDKVAASNQAAPKKGVTVLLL